MQDKTVSSMNRHVFAATAAQSSG